MQIRCSFPDISYLSETQKNNFKFLTKTVSKQSYSQHKAELKLYRHNQNNSQQSAGSYKAELTTYKHNQNNSQQSTSQHKAELTIFWHNQNNSQTYIHSQNSFQTNNNICLIFVRKRRHEVSLITKQKQICNKRSIISTHWNTFNEGLDGV